MVRFRNECCAYDYLFGSSAQLTQMPCAFCGVWVKTPIWVDVPAHHNIPQAELRRNQATGVDNIVVCEICKLQQDIRELHIQAVHEGNAEALQIVRYALAAVKDRATDDVRRATRDERRTPPTSDVKHP